MKAVLETVEFVVLYSIVFIFILDRKPFFKVIAAAVLTVITSHTV